MIAVKREKTSLEQVRLHVIAAVARAVLDHTTSAGPPPVPQFLPAGLGSTLPARSSGRVDGSAQMSKLRAASVAAAVTGSERDLKRVQNWEKQLRGLAVYQPVTAKQRAATEESAEMRKRLERDSRKGARESLAALERYFRWLTRHLEETEGERERIENELLGCASVIATRLLLIAAGLRAERTPLHIRDRLVQLEDRLELEKQHSNRDRLLASARARVAASKRRGTAKSPSERMRGCCYLVNVPALTIQTPSVVIRVSTQRLELDLRAGMCTDTALDALRTVRDTKQPTRTDPSGHIYKRGDIENSVWGAWERLGELVLSLVRTERNERELAVA